MEPVLITLSPHGTSEIYLPHEAEEFGYVLNGAVNIHIGSKIYRAKKGESFYFTPNKKHFISAPQKTGAVILWVSTPPSF